MIAVSKDKSKIITYVGVLVILMVVTFLLTLLYHKHLQANTYSISIEQFHDGKSPVFSLPQGNYILEVNYRSASDAFMDVCASNSCNYKVDLPETGGKDETICDTRLILNYDTDKGYIQLSNDAGRVILNSVIISTDHAIYRDYLFVMALVVFSGILALVVWVFRVSILSKKPQCYVWGLMLSVLVFSHIPIFSDRIRFGIDLRAHLLRINGVYTGLLDHQFPVVLFPNLNNNFGQIGVLYPHLWLYIPAFLRMFRISTYTSYYFFVFVINLFTLLNSYISFRSISKSEKYAAIGAIVYYFAPYRIRLLLVGGAIAGTGLALAFLPLTVSGLISLFERSDRKKWLMLPIGLWGIFVSHIVSTLFTMVILIITSFIFIRGFADKKVLLRLFYSIVLFTLMSMGTLIPFVDYYFEDWNKNRLIFGTFAGVTWGLNEIVGFGGQYRLIILLMLVVVVALSIFLRGVSFPLKKLCKIYAVIAFGSFVLSTRIFPWDILCRIPGVAGFLNSTIQYPDRFLTICEPLVIFALVILLAENDKNQRKHINVSKGALCILTVLLLWGLVVDYIPYRYRTDILLEDAVIGYYLYEMEDYLPDGTETEWYKSDAGTLSDYDAIQITDHNKTWTHVTTSYICPLPNEYIEYPLFYYKDYKAFDENGREMRVEKGDRNYVRVYLEQCDDVHTVNLFFKVRPLYRMGAIISIFAILFVVLACILPAKE